MFPHTELNKNYIHLWACTNITYEKMFHSDITMQLESIRILFHVKHTAMTFIYEYKG